MADRVKLENTEIWLTCHDEGTCYGPVCSLHKRTKHHMRGWRQNWRQDRYMMERVCEHGVGHPDPDDYCILIGIDSGRHGCDGCCRLL